MMKTIYKYITLVVMAIITMGCIQDLTSNLPSAETGDEVQFGLSLTGPTTKTIYGIVDENAKAFPVYWVNGDLVKVYSPECLDGRNNAEYKVTVPDGSTQNYASQLTKTSEIGVQWGNSETANFYSIYPSANTTISSEGNDVVASMNVPSTQMLTHTLTEGIYYAADMNSVIMYAKTNANKSQGAVDLKYIPYSTVIEFDLSGDFSKNADASLFIESLTLAAPESTDDGVAGPSLAGNFNFNFSDLSVSSSGNNRSSVTLQFTTQPELKKSTPQLKAKMCLVPIGISSLEGWSITVTLREGNNTVKTFTKKLTKEEASSTALSAGLVHKIKVAALPATAKWEYTPGEWMPKLPEYEKIYITELSIPGAWYAGAKTGDGYQSTKSFTDLWRAGIRAFGVECRSFTPRQGIAGLANLSNVKPTRICLSGTGGDRNGAYTTLAIPIDGTEMTYISSIISQIAEEVKDTDEFAILVLNYADGGEGGHRPNLDYPYFIPGLQNEINQSSADNIISDINSKTTIEDVKGKLIIKVNVDSRVSYGCTSTNALFSTVPLIDDLDVKSIYYSDLIYGSWTTGVNTYTSSPMIVDNSFLWCFTSANRTDDSASSKYPSYQDRKDALEAMIKHSSEISRNSNHNVWYYFNCGGSQLDPDGDSDDWTGELFASTMNPWLLQKIKQKTDGYTEDGVIYTSDPSPLGIVMFNQCTNSTYKGPEIVRAIIEMNNKFKLKREGGVENTLVGVDSWDTEIL